MNCQAFTDLLDEYRDGTLASREHRDAAAHLRGCIDCQRRTESAQVLGAALRDWPAPPARAGFFDEALQRAQTAHAPRGLRWRYAAGAALAASLALWVGLGWLPQTFDRSATKPAGVTIALHQTHTVQLAFNAEHELHQATLSLTLPEGVELRGFPGERHVRWQTDLARGTNVLSLPLIAVSPTGGTLLARLEHRDRSTEFTVPLYVRDSAGRSAPPLKSSEAIHRQLVPREMTINEDA